MMDNSELFSGMLQSVQGKDIPFPLMGSKRECYQKAAEAIEQSDLPCFRGIPNIGWQTLKSCCEGMLFHCVAYCNRIRQAPVTGNGSGRFTDSQHRLVGDIESHRDALEAEKVSPSDACASSTHMLLLITYHS